MGKQVTLGEKYRDTVTGWIGTATSRHEYMYGCVRVTLEGAAREGTVEEYLFDEQRLVAVETGRPPDPTATSGGSRPRSPRTGLC